MTDGKHIHLIGICGTAMASLAGMLQQRGFRVTGSERGRLAVTVITHAFEALAKSEREAFGAPDHPVVIVRHPIGTVKPEEVRRRADAALDQLLDALVNPQRLKAGIGG